MAPSNDDNEDFATLLAEYESGHGAARRRDPQMGETVRGRVISIGRDSAFVDIGSKSDGVIDLAELRDRDGALTVQVGDELEAHVVESGGALGAIVLRRVIGRGAETRDLLAQAHELGVPVEGTVSGVVKGGVEVQIAGVRAFCPISQLELRPPGDAQAYVGQTLQFRVLRYEEQGPRRNVVLSRRVLLEEEAAAQASVTRTRLVLGAVLPGRVTALKDFGAFVDLGGIEGMLHVSELGFARVARPQEMLQVGQELQVQVIKLEKSDDPRRPERVSLSLKALERDPWSDVATRFVAGARFTGTVVRLESFGAFVELVPGVEGLVHVGELGQRRRLRHAREVLRNGQTIDVIVLEIDVDKRRLALGLADAREDEATTPTAPSAPARLGTFADLFKKGS